MHIQNRKDEPQECVHSWHTLTLPSSCDFLPCLLKLLTLEDKKAGHKTEPFQIGISLRTTTANEAWPKWPLKI